MALEVTDLADLSAATRTVSQDDRMTEISQDLQKMVAMGDLMENHKITHAGGDRFEFQVMTTFTDNAENVGLYHVDTPTTGDVLTTGYLDWRHTTVNFSMDAREPALNSGDKVRILDFAKLKRMSARISLARRFEKNFWGKPSTSADKTRPHGIDSFITYPAAWSADGFVGVNPPGFTSGVGINSTTYPRWANYYARYTNVSQKDFGDEMCDCFYETDFESPIPNKEIADYSTGTAHKLYSNWALVRQLRHLLRDQNDDLGVDFAKYHNTATFMGIPIVPVPFLDSSKSEHSDLASYNPVYFIDWGVAKFEFLSGWDQREHVKEAPNQHTVATTYIDSSYQFAIRDRRRCGLLSLAIA